jgi:hypothetical protein
MTHIMIPRTNYLMEQESSLMQVQAGSDGIFERVGKCFSVLCENGSCLDSGKLLGYFRVIFCLSYFKNIWAMKSCMHSYMELTMLNL